MNFFEMLSNFLYPPKCGICNKINKNYICENCYRKMYKTISKQSGSGNINGLHIQKYRNRYFKKHIYLFKYAGIIREKIIAYKFRDKAFYYNFFVKIIIKNKKMCRFLKSYDIIIPVPISKKRLKERGYNQTELIARRLAEYIDNLDFENNILIKIKNTKPQSLLNKQERIKNLIGVYKAVNIQKITNKKILLFDDVFTTGSTSNECCKILKQNGAKIVDVFTIAKD